MSYTNKNIKIAKQLIKLAKNLIASLKINNNKYFSFDAKGQKIDLLIIGEVNNISDYSTEQIDKGTQQFFKEAVSEIKKAKGNPHKWTKDNTKQENAENIYYFLEGDIKNITHENYEQFVKELKNNGWQDVSPSYLMNMIKKFF